MKRATVSRCKSLAGEKYLTMCKDVSVIESAPDIATVADVSDEDKLDSDKILRNAEIVAIPEFVHKEICHRCGSKVSPGLEIRHLLEHA